MTGLDCFTLAELFAVSTWTAEFPGAGAALALVVAEHVALVEALKTGPVPGTSRTSEASGGERGCGVTESPGALSGESSVWQDVSWKRFVVGRRTVREFKLEGAVRMVVVEGAEDARDEH